ncbi:M23 family metallopeptidase [Ponticaulis sp.]|uniref:M23 family metallopeptidase n=1 Tax=Ponticaulis sp. TaxID=2020902 RepID=UPI0026375A32|nr:M23 family metallopeptidase [Ponticaulis sp.]MDF1681907.1 M23 family metallopeptidase [Ponticaulis sp.]
MLRSIAVLSASALFFAACASNPAPVRNGRTQATVPPASGPVIQANVERLYPNERLFLCTGSRVSNAPDTDSNREVIEYSRLVVVNGVPLVTAPANNACVSSGFGIRTLNGRTRPHNGLDITSRPASRVFSGGAGTILEAGYNSGFGLSILIDHGSGVYTRYAHLEYVEDNIEVGEPVHYGEPLGRMGASGHVTGIHLHYEVLTGTYQAGVWGRGLTPRNPFDFPPWIDPRLALTETEAAPLSR